MENICTDNTHSKIWYIMLFQSTVMNSMLYKQIGNCMESKNQQIIMKRERERDNKGAAKNWKDKNETTTRNGSARAGMVFSIFQFVSLCRNPLMASYENLSTRFQFKLLWKLLFVGVAQQLSLLFFPLFFLPGDYIVEYFFSVFISSFCSAQYFFFFFIQIRASGYGYMSNDSIFRGVWILKYSPYS